MKMLYAARQQLDEIARRDVALGKGDPRWAVVTQLQRRHFVRFEWTEGGQAMLRITEQGRAALRDGAIPHGPEADA